MFSQGTVIASKYRLLSRIGGGGFGDVWSAEDIRFPARRVAVKLLRIPADSGPRERRILLQSLEREIQRLGSLGTHPNVVTLHEHLLDNDPPALVYELLEGETLRSRLDQGPLSPQDTLAVLTPLLEVLAWVHEKGVCHRDIKPANLFLCGPPVNALKILDFGISGVAGATRGTLTAAGTGTPWYMALEHLQCAACEASDVYSAGVVAWEMLVGTPAAADAPDPGNLQGWLKAGGPRPVARVARGCPEWLARVVDRLCAVDLATRPANGGEARRLLAEAVAAEQARQEAEAAEQARQEARKRAENELRAAVEDVERARERVEQAQAELGRAQKELGIKEQDVTARRRALGLPVQERPVKPPPSKPPAPVPVPRPAEETTVPPPTPPLEPVWQAPVRRVARWTRWLVGVGLVASWGACGAFSVLALKWPLDDIYRFLCSLAPSVLLLGAYALLRTGQGVRSGLRWFLSLSVALGTGFLVSYYFVNNDDMVSFSLFVAGVMTPWILLGESAKMAGMGRRWACLVLWVWSLSTVVLGIGSLSVAADARGDEEFFFSIAGLVLLALFLPYNVYLSYVFLRYWYALGKAPPSPR